MENGDSSLEARFRPRIEAELTALAAASRSSAEERAPVRLDQQSVGRLARMDAMQVQAMALAAERRRQTRIASLNAALERMGRGEYGDCVNCGETIAEGRLEFDPTIRLCLACARRDEG